MEYVIGSSSGDCLRVFSEGFPGEILQNCLKTTDLTLVDNDTMMILSRVMIKNRYDKTIVANF